ncbi:sodium-dependent neutral amino acid transporter SLC6A17 [Platysternon megacephalum]|uniref:Sodium-dependent neutral amino acid transporter SLC6A17 n=1 Tax=Platysternon megacephalum TaxID=55544 RepID=A0A4D9E260_9SAUR|nr:sodium-dependent neutral amino acid transporter SLC6A17 [Platysternon megacephalum]
MCRDPGFLWLIGDGADTTIRVLTHCSYDSNSKDKTDKTTEAPKKWQEKRREEKALEKGWRHTACMPPLPSPEKMSGL